MPAKDIYHDLVRNALEREGWTITHDPLLLQVGGVEMSIDLGAEILIAAEKEGQKIAVYNTDREVIRRYCACFSSAV